MNRERLPLSSGSASDAGVAALEHRVELHDAGEPLGEGLGVTHVHGQLRAGAKAIVFPQRALHLRLREPRRILCGQLLVEERAEEDVRGAGAGLQGALCHVALAVGNSRAAGRQLDTDEEPRGTWRGVAAFERGLVAARHAHVADLAKIPFFTYILAAVVVDVQVLARRERHRDRDCPARTERMAVRADQVPVAGADLVVVAGNLAHAHLAGAGAWLALVDGLVAQVERVAFGDARSLRRQVGVQRAVGRAAAGVGGKGKQAGQRGSSGGKGLERRWHGATLSRAAHHAFARAR